ncbi:hypothetical protein BGZ63DRAFT_145458 [Mariannaea sp. PMI_226]|nr:hypothetical protein BGZ63DRAFT_145458 [Mariannaea sp. PMI_226]
MSGHSYLRTLLGMASQAAATFPASTNVNANVNASGNGSGIGSGIGSDIGSGSGNASGSNAPRPATTTYYFAYGSNLHLQQMKKRCPGSKFIGCARLHHYRWQINERGYANVVQAEGRWVDGLVYEIDKNDEARLDINEGVSKNAYAKQYLTVLLTHAEPSLYRRPTAWIVDKGGPDRVRQLAVANNIGQGGLHRPPQQWQQGVLVYISLTCIVDSQPKDEYVHRINMGVNDARALGVEDDYISNCIRPFVPLTHKKPQNKAKKATNTGGGGGGGGSGSGGTGGAGGSSGHRTSDTGQTGPVRRDATEPRRPNGQGNKQSQGTKRNSTHGSATPSPPRTDQPAPARRSAASSPGRQAQASTRRTDAPRRASVSNAGRRSTGNFLVVPAERRRASSDVGPNPPPLPPRPARRMRSIPVLVFDDRVIRLARLS